ncbi:hypothetical protein PENTCL1PPCAC_22150, partial [Pristionchus entomophagus]
QQQLLLSQQHQQQHPMGFFYGHHPSAPQPQSVQHAQQLQQHQQAVPSGSSPINGATAPGGQPEDDLHSLSSDTSGHFSSGASTSSRGDMATPPRASGSSSLLTPMTSSSSSSASSSTPDSAPSRSNNTAVRSSGGMDEQSMIGGGQQSFVPSYDDLVPTFDFHFSGPSWESIWQTHLSNSVSDHI